jgi:sulfate adenylyltransferase subunit 1 (EFTu-like GTPase family)
MPWYRGTTLIGHLEAVDIKSSNTDDGALTFPVQWVNRPNLDFRGYAGWMTHGRVAPGDAIVALPSGRRSTVTRLVTYDGDLSEAVAGQALTLTLADEIDVSRGDVIVSANYKGKPRSLIPARILWMSERALADGSTYFLKLGTATAQAKISVSRAVDIHTYEEGETQRLNMNEIGIAAITLDRPIVASEYSEDRELGGFILIDRWTNETMALGLVDSSLSPKVAADGIAQVVPSGIAGRLTTFLAADLPLRRQTRGGIFSRVLLGYAPLAVIIGGIIGALSGSLLLGLGVAIVDVVACALLSLWMQDSGLAVDESRLRDEANVDGDGI